MKQHDGPAQKASGPPLSSDAVEPTFARWWADFSENELASHPLRTKLDARVAAGATTREAACDTLAQHIRERAPTGSSELLHGDPAALQEHERCWWLHHDGLMGPGLGAALSIDGRVLAVWIVLEG